MLVATRCKCLVTCLQGLIRDRWSGTITANTAEWKKRIYLDQGRFCFATSTLMDDRSG